MKLKPILTECWTGYKQVGMKNKGGKQVPNCVPVTESTKDDIIKDLDKAKNDLLKKVDTLIAKKKKLYSDVDIETPMTADEKKLDKDIADLFSDINKLVLQKRSLKENQAVSGGKVHKLITGKNLKFKGKSYNQIDFETLGVDNNNGTIRLRIIAPKEIFGNEMSLDFKTIRRGPFFKTDTSNQLGEGLYYVGYNKGRGQGTGVFKDSYSSYKDAKKEVEKLEKQRGGSYNMIAYYVADKDGKFVRESANEATTSSAPGQWVAYLSMARGKKLLKTFDTARGAKQYLSKNVDKLLGGSNVESVGIMTKKQWDVGEAKYAIEGVNEISSNVPKIFVKTAAVEKKIKELMADRKKAVVPYNNETDPKKKEALKQILIKLTNQIKGYEKNLIQLRDMEEEYIQKLNADAELEVESILSEKQFKGLEGIPSNKSLEDITKDQKLKIIKSVGNIIDFIVPKGVDRNFWQVIGTGKIQKNMGGNYVLVGKIISSPAFKSLDDLIKGVNWKSMESRRRFNESVNEATELKWQDVEVGDVANVKAINKTGLIIKTYGRKFHLKFPNGSTKTYDASELTFIKN